ncbi:hypothetical protein DFH08DRAFT_1028017 [Mycena albidolilacea]|uniref:Uncharacterized protein n=1 Tax=Mycena albidolilacea TaxID=1033008 RepID=A0AAD6ZKI1_9AGAR|nr:hypothetical protein DFH08DRAFT_1028017 [Mycena albidolilacea]
MSDLPSANQSRINDQLKVLRKAIETEVPYTGGVHVIKAEDLLVYYDVEGEANPRRINLGKASGNDLAQLTAACQQATFGVGGAYILDETYRRAGKMDHDKFAACFDVAELLETISPDILQGQNSDSDKYLKAEMYKLNVYGAAGPGSFFKSYKDTPRSENMIGSLVVIFPTPHAGGALTLEHDEKSWVFDSAAELAAASSTPSLASYIRGTYRVTLTYNLFLADRHAPKKSKRHVPEPEHAFESTLRTLLGSDTFLPSGGLLAYGLTHQYPLPTPPETVLVNFKHRMPPGTRLGPILWLLKGSDARIRTVSERIGLATHLKVLYDTGDGVVERYNFRAALRGNDILADDVLNTEHVDEGNDMSTIKEEVEAMGTLVQRRPERTQELKEKLAAYQKDVPRSRFDEYKEQEEAARDEKHQRAAGQAIPVHWVTKITELNRVGSSHLAYGNQASLGHVYGNAALFVEVPAVGEGVRAFCAPGVE